MHDQEHIATDTEPVQEPVQEPTPEFDNTLLDIPEVKMLVTYYRTKIEDLKSDRAQQPFMKKMKLKRLNQEFGVLVLGIRQCSKLLQQLEHDPDNIQIQADVNAFGYRFAYRCQQLMLGNGLGVPAKAVADVATA